MPRSINAESWDGDDAFIDWIEQAVRELPMDCRRAFELVKIDGLSQAQAAEQLGMSVSRLRRYLARAIARLYALHREASAEGGENELTTDTAGSEPLTESTPSGKRIKKERRSVTTYH